MNAKEAGQSSVEANNAAFLHKMRVWARAICRCKGEVSTDDLRWHCREEDVPTHENAWGAVFRGKHWRKVGTVTSTWPSNHYREIKLWEYVE